MNQKEYFTYLKGRSFLADLYRRRMLYPALSRQFTGKVLDVGCGIGDFLAFRKNTVGVDINIYNVNFCRERNLEAHIIENGRYPFGDQSFDGAILDNVLEHLPDPTPTLTEITRVIRPGGIFIVGVPGKKGYTMDDDHKHFYDEDALISLMNNHNYRLLKFVYGPLFVKSDFLSRTLSQYCVYAVFKKSEQN